MTIHYRHRHIRTGGAFLAAAAIAMTGCSSAAVEGTADPATTIATAERAPVMIPAAPGELDPGFGFTTTPSDYPKTAGDPEIGGVVESQRMAEFLVMPAEVDPALSEGKLDYTRPIFGPFPWRICSTTAPRSSS